MATIAQPTATAGSRRKGQGRWSFSRSEWTRLSGMGAVILLLHVVGWGLVVLYAGRYPELAGLGAIAYSLGLRPAFDADHIAAIDNTTRKFLSEGKRQFGTGFFFSLGHSSVVLIGSLLLALGAKTVASKFPAFHRVGSVIGLLVSGGFLYLIGILNLLVLVGIVRIYREMKSGRYDAETLDQTLNERGFMNRFLGRLFRLIRSSWQMYPLGFLFGLGFDTTTEITFLAITATAASQLPFAALVSLPVLFAAGMCLMDTADGVFMTQAYGWAFSNPLRKVYYNISVTGLSVAVALMVGTVEFLQVIASQFHLRGPLFSFAGALNFQVLGFIIVGMFVATWAFSVAYWKLGRVEERWSVRLDARAPERGPTGPR
jgi:high-affinity nickel-transport protein